MDLFQYEDTLVYRSVYTPVKSNMYTLITDKEAIVLDPCEDKVLLELFHEKGVEKVHILLTHEHYDHISGVMWLKEHTNADIYCQARCADRIVRKRDTAHRLVAMVLAQQDKEDGGHRYSDFKDSFKSVSIIADKTFEKEDTFAIGDLEISVKATPGHCPGAACYSLLGKIVFTGDSLLQNNPTITRFPESNKEDFEKITLPYLKSLAKDTVIMPGHGDPFLLNEIKNI